MQYLLQLHMHFRTPSATRTKMNMPQCRTFCSSLFLALTPLPPPRRRRRAACSTKPQLIVINLHVLFFQTLSAGRVWGITKGCSTSRPRSPRWMKTSTSSSLASLVGHLELLRKEPAYDQRLVRAGTSDRAKHIWTRDLIEPNGPP